MVDISDAQIRETYLRTGSKRQTSIDLGLPRTTVRNKLKRMAQRGELLDAKPAMPGYRIAQVTTGPNGEIKSVQQRPEHGEEFKVPPGHGVKGVSALTDANGRIIQQWTKTKEGELDPIELAERIRGAMQDVPAVSPLTPPASCDLDSLTLYPLADWHVGLHAWGREVGESWDLKIAEERIGAAVDSVVSRSPASGTAVVLGGGDLTHSDDRTNATPTSKHLLQVDGRYPKVIDTAIRLVARTVDRARERHDEVVLRVLEGNHDPHAHVAVTYAMAERYRNEPRVTVDLSPSPFWRFQFGKVMLAATHGHLLKGPAYKEMPAIMASYWPEMWGATKHRFAHTFHYHHRERHIDEHGGVVTEIHQAPIPQDVHAFGAGYFSGRSLQSATYHRDLGHRGGVSEAIG